MPRLIVVVGLPGSGKTHLVRKLARQEGIAAFTEVFAGFPLLEGRFAWLIAALAKGRDCVAEHVTFCHGPNRDLLGRYLRESFDVTPEWVFFENDLATCLLNVVGDRIKKGRSDFEGRLKALLHHHPIYEIPAGVTPRPVKPCYEVNDLGATS